MDSKIIEITANALKINQSRIKVKERFLGGMSNYTYHLIIDEQDYVARIIGDKGEAFVNFKTEKVHLELAQKLGVTAKTLFLDLDTGFKVAEYLPGLVLSKEITNHDYQTVATTLKKLHYSDMVANDYGLIERLNSYQALLSNDRSEQFLKLKQEWLMMYHQTYIKHPKVFTHGDAQRSNIVINQKQAYLLDFEFAGQNDPYYDIASFGNIDFLDSIKLLEVYLGEVPSEEQLNRLRFYRMYQALQWHLVATYKAEIGLSEKLKIDFAFFASKYLSFAQTLFNLIKE